MGKIIKNEEENLSLHAIIIFRKAIKTIDSHVMTDIREKGLTPAQFSVLEILYSKGRLKICQLIEKVLSSSGNMTVVIRNMEKKGWIDKKTDENDRRAFFIELTENGKRIIEELLPRHIESVERAFNILTEEDKRNLIEILRKFKEIS